MSVLALYAARCAAWLWRFGTVRLAARLCESVGRPCLTHRSFAGRRLHLDVSRSVTHALLYLEGERLVGERRLLARLVKPGMRIVDVGANIGYYVLLLEKLAGPSARIVAIEPSPENLPELRLNIERNGLRNVRLLEVAAGAADSVGGLLGGINSGVVARGAGAYEVSVRPLDELLTEPVDFLKIDVDGFEGQVLEGAQRILERDRPILFLEFHPELVSRVGHSFESIRAQLARTYDSIQYFDLPDRVPLLKKIATRYLGAEECRELAEPPSEPMHLGRQYGTFWIVCR